MARIRTIKPEFWTSPQVARVSFAARLLFIGTWNFADDYGNLPRDPDKLKMQVFPGDVIDVQPLIESLIDAGLLIEYTVNDTGERFLHIPTFRKHQVINRPSKRLYPSPDGLLPSDDDKRKSAGSRSANGSLNEHSQLERKGVGKEGKGVNLKTKGTKGSGRHNPRVRARATPDAPTPTGPATLTLAMRKASISGAQPSNPRIIALAEAGITPEIVSDACDEAHRAHPDESVGVAYVCSILERWQSEARRLHVSNGHPPPARASPAAAFDERAQDRKRAIDVLTGRGQKARDVVDVEAKEIGHEPDHR